MKDEKKVIFDGAVKDVTYSNERTFNDEAEAGREFSRSIQKLFDVDRWSELPGITSNFELHDNKGTRKPSAPLQVGDHVKIILPGVPLDNWVVVTDIKIGENSAECTTSPSPDPQAKGKDAEQVKHFFIAEATSTFRVDLKGKTIRAYELGRTEGINNKGEEAGSRKVINTLIAEGGWAGFQKLQWDKVTKFLVHAIELE